MGRPVCFVASSAQISPLPSRPHLLPASRSPRGGTQMPPPLRSFPLFSCRTSLLRSPPTFPLLPVVRDQQPIPPLPPRYISPPPLRSFPFLSRRRRQVAASHWHHRFVLTLPLNGRVWRTSSIPQKTVDSNNVSLFYAADSADYEMHPKDLHNVFLKKDNYFAFIELHIDQSLILKKEGWIFSELICNY